MSQSMAVRTSRRALYMLAGATLLAISVTRGVSAEEPGVKRALLIGINRYLVVPSLQGSVNDVETMRQLLISKWGFAPQNIELLTDEAATRAAMVAAMERLVSIAKPQDFVYFHYSGHGSQVEDIDGDEPDGLDETLVPQDGRSPDVRDIAHDDLVDLFGRLKARRAVIVLDSCHSGTGLRAMDVRSRAIPQDMRIELYIRDFVQSRAIIPAPSTRYIVLAAAAANEEALDGPIDGQYHGYFTHALAKSMSESPAGTSAKDVFAGIARELNRIQAQLGRSSMPEPQLEGPASLLDAPLVELPAAGTGAERPRLPWLSVRPVGGQLVLADGRLLGAVPGSEWAIYPPGEIKFTPGRALGVASVIRLDGPDALAQLRASASGPAIAPDSRAVALLPPSAGDGVRIRILDASPARRHEIEAALARDINKVTFVGPGQPAKFLVDAGSEGVKLLTGDGLEVAGTFGTDPAQWSSGIALIVARARRAADLLALDNPSTQLTLSVKVADSQTTTTRGIAVVADTHPAKYRIRRSGDVRSAHNSLQLDITVGSDAYITIVDVDTEGHVNLLFPNEAQRRDFHPDGMVHARQTVRIPDSLQSGNRAGFYWDYSPPQGQDVVRVFASSDLSTANLIRSRVRSMRTTGPSPGTAGRAVAENIEGLRDDVTALATRNISVVADTSSGAADWTASSVTIAVSE
jgi:hypothetical protein